jgi:hypothetical protein
VGGIAGLPELAVSLLQLRGVPRHEADALVSLAPPALQDAPCFLDRLSGGWLYDFGEPVVVSGGGLVFGGGKTWHEVMILLDVLRCARTHLAGPALATYLGRLSDTRKHAESLFEFAPILRLASGTIARYEVPGHGQGNRLIDWKITAPDGFALLLEVKAREADLIRSFERTHAGERGPDGHVPEPDHDTDLLFRSVEGKFLPGAADEMPQGVWIGSALMQEGRELEDSFRRLDPTRVHFAMIGDWDGRVHLLSRDGVPRDRVVAALGVRESDRLVFQRGQAVTEKCRA